MAQTSENQTKLMPEGGKELSDSFDVEMFPSEQDQSPLGSIAEIVGDETGEHPNDIQTSQSQIAQVSISSKQLPKASIFRTLSSSNTFTKSKGKKLSQLSKSVQSGDGSDSTSSDTASIRSVSASERFLNMGKSAFSKLHLNGWGSANVTEQRSRMKSSDTATELSNDTSRHSFFDLEDETTRFILLNSKPAPETLGERSQLQCRRLENMEKLIVKMTDSATGLSIKSRRKNLKVYPLCAIGSEIVDWLFRNCNFLQRWEAERFAQEMLSTGYIINADVDDYKFHDGSSLYSFQNIYFWPSKNWSPSDLDYASYLVRKAIKDPLKKVLAEEEENRLAQLKVTLKKDWDKIIAGMEKQQEYIETIDKEGKRLFLMREAAFWRLHRPLKTARIGTYVEIEERKNALEKSHMSESEYEATLNKEQLYDHLERRLYSLQIAFRTNKLKSSTACKNLIARSEVWEPIDPLLLASCFNPFRDDDYSSSNLRNAPNEIDIKIWKASFKDLLNDPLGVQYFMKFLEGEFSSENLKFYLECQELDNEQGREEWKLKAKDIYRRFVIPKASFEINIDAQVRKIIIDKFEALEAQEREKPTKVHELDIYVFSEAINRILALMAKDSYSRFITSEFCKTSSARAE